MIDPDISTADALRLLTARDNIDAAGMDRRRFLQMMGWGVGAGALFGGLGEVLAADLLPGRLREAWATTPVGPNEGILVLIGQFGGSDGLNVVVPHSNSLYYEQHGDVAIPAAQVLPINGQVGLHPNLPYLKSLYDAGQVAIVQGVGYANPDLSHFSSMALWMHGKVGGGLNNGWVGRWLDGLGGDDPFRASSSAPASSNCWANCSVLSAAACSFSFRSPIRTRSGSWPCSILRRCSSSKRRAPVAVSSVSRQSASAFSFS